MPELTQHLIFAAPGHNPVLVTPLHDWVFKFIHCPPALLHSSPLGFVPT
ncbi:hypothetical protein KKG52_03380 [Patescibacteria group bacterium]|nr:hypothetical protein [Patescibacteria group bacterium]